VNQDEIPGLGPGDAKLWRLCKTGVTGGELASEREALLWRSEEAAVALVEPPLEEAAEALEDIEGVGDAARV
jgi:hypothetical protein